MSTVLLKSVQFNGFSEVLSPGYTVYNPDLSVHQNRTTDGVERLIPSANIFVASIDLPDTCIVLWDDGNDPTEYGAETYNQGSASFSVFIGRDDL